MGINESVVASLSTSFGRPVKRVFSGPACQIVDLAFQLSCWLRNDCALAIFLKWKKEQR